MIITDDVPGGRVARIGAEVSNLMEFYMGSPWGSRPRVFYKSCAVVSYPIEFAHLNAADNLFWRSPCRNRKTGEASFWRVKDGTAEMVLFVIREIGELIDSGAISNMHGSQLLDLAVPILQTKLG